MNRYSELLIDYSGPALNIINGNSAYDSILATRNYGKLKHKSWAFDKEFNKEICSTYEVIGYIFATTE